MDYSLPTFDGAHFAHIFAWQEHHRLRRIRNRLDRARGRW